MSRPAEPGVDTLFVLCEVRALSEAAAKFPSIDGRHAAEVESLRQNVAANRLLTEIYDCLKLLADTGSVKLYGCQFGASMFDVDESNLRPESAGARRSELVLAEKALKVDHCQYF